MTRKQIISDLRDVLDNQELSADQRKKLEAAIEDLKETPQGRDAGEALQAAIVRIAFWLLLEDLM